MQSDPYRCLEISVLKKPRSSEARQLLEQVAKQVQPIMRKRQWTVKKLSEFSPRNPGLLGLNVNRGAEVKIRLRPARDDDSFYEWHHILGTMLHELCHILISPHNAAFYKLLDELWAEAEDLMDRGISGSGQGFDAPSAGRLGSHGFIPTHNPPPHKMADAIRKAAEARAKQQSLMPAGPRKLGSAAAGSGRASGIDHRQLTPAQAAAAAAERRARDNVWCGAEHTADEVEQEVGQQQPDVEQPSTAAPAAAATASGARTSAAAAAAGAGSSARPPTAGHPQQLQQQGDTSRAPLQQPQPQVAQQQGALQQQWQQHLQQQQQQRQRQQQEQRQRKRPAVDTVDLTLSDSEDEAAGRDEASGSGRVPQAAADGCPCCAAEVQGPLDAAVMRRLQQRRGYRQWCAAHRPLQEQQQQEPASGGRWTCSVCTLVNPVAVLVCEACLSLKNRI